MKPNTWRPTRRAKKETLKTSPVLLVLGGYKPKNRDQGPPTSSYRRPDNPRNACPDATARGLSAMATGRRPTRCLRCTSLARHNLCRRQRVAVMAKASEAKDVDFARQAGP